MAIYCDTCIYLKKMETQKAPFHNAWLKYTEQK